MTTFFQNPKKSVGTWLNRLVLLGCISILAACGGGGPAGGVTPPPVSPVLLYSQVMDMKGSGLVLQNNENDDLTVNTNGLHNFSTPVYPGETYHVTTLTDPTGEAGETCTPKEGPGIVGATSPKVDVQCSVTTYTIGGTVNNLESGTTLKLKNNGTDVLPITGNGPSTSFTFNQPIAAGGSYTVVVDPAGGQPAGQTCTVDGKTGSGTNVNENIKTIVVTCSKNIVNHSVGGTVSGLFAGNQVTLVNNNDFINPDNRVTVSKDGIFTFKGKIADHGSYDVKVASWPDNQPCSIVGNTGQGSDVTSDVTTVQVACGAKSYTVGGIIKGLTSGKSVMLQNDNLDTQNPIKDSLTTTSTGTGDIPFTFTKRVAPGSNSNVTVTGQPSGLVCTVSNKTYEHLAINAKVDNIVVVCSDAANAHNIGYTVTGLLTNGVTAIDNGDYTDPNTVTQNNTLTNFKTQLADGGSYDVRMTKMPFLQFCTLGNGSGNNVDRDITTVTVACDPPKYSNAFVFDGQALGAVPAAALIQDKDGNFYGTTFAGGTNGLGTVYKITPDGKTLTSIYSFNGTNAPAAPAAALVLGRDGNLYGTTSEGGASNLGTVFKLSTDGSVMEVLYEFTTPDGITAPNGSFPLAGLIEDASISGTFYGTTSDGGDNSTGTIFRITANKQFTKLFSFTADGVAFGRYPKAALLQVGNVFYGTAWAGGANDSGTGGAGTIYSFTLNGDTAAMKREYSFKTRAGEGSRPLASLVKSRDDGKLYGTTDQGATDSFNATVFSFDPVAGVLTTLMTLGDPTIGDKSPGGLVQGPVGDSGFYGITRQNKGGSSGSGASIYRIDPNAPVGSNFRRVYSFGDDNKSAPNKSAQPLAGLMVSSDENLYGTISEAGTPTDNGAVFKLGRP